MTLNVYKDNGSINKYEINKEQFFDSSLSQRVSYIGSSSKEENALMILKSYFSNSKSILFDNTNKSIKQKLESLNVDSFDSISCRENIFTEYDFSFLYFTSGTTGFPLGAFKTKENILSEIKELSILLLRYNIKRVIVTVPFIHFYGSLLGLMFPLLNDIDIVLKEHFLPNDLLDFIDENSLVVTTPLYITALLKMSNSKNLSSSIFLSSTAPLYPDIAKEFNKKFSTNIIQIFGSTETGGIAYKYNDENLWTPLNSVRLFLNENSELRVESPFVSKILYENDFKETKSSIQTFDYVELIENKFKVIGRSSQILKVAGKRYSTLQIENILESQKEINKALVTILPSKDSFRGESIKITIESIEKFKVSGIKKILKKELSNIKFNITLDIVEEIKTTSLGKKIAF